MVPLSTPISFRFNPYTYKEKVRITFFSAANEVVWFLQFFTVLDDKLKTFQFSGSHLHPSYNFVVSSVGLQFEVRVIRFHSSHKHSTFSKS